MAGVGFLMSKLVNINSSITSSSVSLNSKSYIDSSVEIDGFMNVEKISKLVKILINNDSSKIKDIIESDIDKDFSAYLIKDNHFDDTYLIEIFSIYLKSSDMDNKTSKLLKVIIDKLLTKSSLKKCKKILEDNYSKNKFFIENLLNEIDQASSKITNSVDYVLDD
jgi:hypothetical protein